MSVGLPIEVENSGRNEACPKRNTKRTVRSIDMKKFVIRRMFSSEDFLRCCGSCPFASLLAFFLTLAGTAVCCGCLYHPLRATIEKINNVFEIEYIDYDW